MESNHFTRSFFIATLALVTGGCATVSGMPLQSHTETIYTSEKSILVAKVKIRNDSKTTDQPNLRCIFLSKSEGEESRTYSFNRPTLLADHGEGGG